MRLHAVTPMIPSRNDPPADWQQVSERLHRFALALTGRAEEADELTQQTLAHLLARAPEKASHAGYARRTMTRLWMDRQRAWRRRLQRHAKIACEAMSRPVADGMSDRELSAMLRRRIDLLPAQQRAVLVLRVIENLEYEHIAEALGTSIAAVRANLHLARRTLARSVGDLL